MKSIKLYFLYFALILSPIFLFAQSPVNPGNTTPTIPSSGTSAVSASTGITYECKGGAPGECTFTDLILAVRHFFGIAIPLAIGFSVIIIAYAGFLYMTSGGSPGNRAQANKMFISVAWGIFFMLAAWLIVTLVLNSLTKPCQPGQKGCIPRLLN